MALERERKFLPSKPVKEILAEGNWSTPSYIEQGYLMVDKELGRDLRVRLIRNKVSAVHGQPEFTYKSGKGEKRQEYNFDLRQYVAKELLATCKWKLTKTRYSKYVNHKATSYPFAVYKLDMDIYHDGTVVIEMEWNYDDDWPTLPDCLGEEVTGKDGYSNVAIAMKGGK